MAHLNVRERLIETTIAYVGSQLAGKATNLDCVSRDETRGHSSAIETAGDVLSVDWRPLRRSLDCEVAVRVVAAKGALSSQRLDDVLAKADGLVVVVDANPAAAEETLRTLRVVQEKAPKVPIVVQVNKTDLADARPAHEVVGDIAWPVVAAAATRGEGVFETLETALASVIESMSKKKLTGGEAKIDQNPLLTALREILRETVVDCIEQIEEQAAKRVALSIQQHFAALEERTGQIHSAVIDTGHAVKKTGDAVAKTGDAVAKTGDAIAKTSDFIAKTGDSLAKTGDLVAKASEESRRVHTAHDKALGEIARAVAELQTGTLDLVTRADFSLQEERRGMQLATIAKAIEPINLVPKITARLGAIDTSLHVTHSETGEALQRVEERLAKVDAELHELIEELKKPKRGWFG